ALAREISRGGIKLPQGNCRRAWKSCMGGCNNSLSRSQERERATLPCHDPLTVRWPPLLSPPGTSLSNLVPLAGRSMLLKVLNLGNELGRVRELEGDPLAMPASRKPRALMTVTSCGMSVCTGSWAIV